MLRIPGASRARRVFAAAGPPDCVSRNLIGGSNIVGFEKIVLWVRDVTLPSDSGDPTLLAIGTRTGNVEAHAVNFDLNLGDYYIFTRDGVSTGT